MLQLIDEFDAVVFIPVNSIKYFRENKGGVYYKQHLRANVEVVLHDGSRLYIKNSIEEILSLFNSNQGTN